METLKNYEIMTDVELNNRVRELSKMLDTLSPSDDRWDMYYTEYCRINAILDERYREESQADFDAFYEKYIKGKKWEEIDPEDWQTYSDWHKDMYGYRPRTI